jgi:predicted amidohydrolase
MTPLHSLALTRGKTLTKIRIHEENRISVGFSELGNSLCREPRKNGISLLPTIAAMKIRVAACQQPLHEEISVETLERIHQLELDYLCLPEHYPLAKEITNLQEAAALYPQRKNYLLELSSRVRAVLIGGTLTENTAGGYYNTCYVFDAGKEIGAYRKVHPTQREQAAGVLQGSEFKVFEIRNLKVGVLICADVLNARSFAEMASLRCQITFVPTASPFRPNEKIEEKFERDQSIFVEGARQMGCPIIKTCGVGTTFGHPIQGRSLIATPEGIVARVSPDQENVGTLIHSDLEI